MDSYIDRLLSRRVSGVEAQHWVLFFKTYAESQESTRITEKLQRELQRMEAQASDEVAARLGELLHEFAGILGGQ